jgi:hypothetical protein
VSEEKTQIFRGDEPPEMAIADTTEIKRTRARKGPSDQRAVQDQKDGETFSRGIHDARDGHTEQRSMHDGDGPSDQRRMEDAQGLSDRREMHDQQGLHVGGAIGDTGLAGDEAGHELGAAETTEQSEAGAEVVSDPDLTFKIEEEEAAPWALSIHLEERIASLGESTAKVNRELDRFEQSIQRLAKRIAK